MRSSPARLFTGAKGSKPLPVYLLQLAGTFLLLASPVFAQTNRDQTPPGPASPHRHANRTYLGQDIFVAPGQQIGSATCLFCSVQVEGELSGNVFVLFGNLTVTGRVAGNTAVVGGNTVVDSLARIDGSTTVIGGNAVYETDESLSGNAFVLGGHISSFAGRRSSHHRVSLSPTFSAALAVLAVLVLAVLVFPRSRQHSFHT